MIETAAYNAIQKQREYGFDLAAPGTFGSVHEVKHANRQKGHTWFERDEMRIFGTRGIRLHEGCVLTFSNRNYDDTAREHRVALLEPDGGVVTLLEPKFESAERAARFAKVLVRHLKMKDDR